MRVKNTKDGRTYAYSGDLRTAIEAAKKELDKKTTSKERGYLQWQYEKAKKAHVSYEQRIKDLGNFINLGKDELSKQLIDGEADK